MPWSSCLSSSPVKIISASCLDLIFPGSSLHPISAHLCDFLPISLFILAQVCFFQSICHPLTMFSSCFDARNVLGFMSRFVSTIFMWFFSQRIHFLFEEIISGKF